MGKLIAIGEALIDFIPSESGKPIKSVSAFYPKVGGAPANVCGAFTKLGGKSQLITQLGEDPFGDKIIEEFQKYNIGCDYVSRTREANTALAFVALKENGNREFSFYRSPSADMLLSPENIKEEWFEDGFCLHFCSVSLGDFPMREAHKRAIQLAIDNNMLVSFDPNVRFPLWKSKEELRKAILDFLPMAHIVKISDEEMEFITGTTDIEKAKEFLLKGNTKVVVYTRGPQGADIFTKDKMAHSDCEDVKVVDTTGAGDAFVGSFLYKLYENNVNVNNLDTVSVDTLREILDFSNRYCTVSVTRKGAIDSYPEKI